MPGRILLIDDDSDDRALFNEALEEVSPETICITEADARKALSDLFNNHDQLPDLIFIDINMPRMSGWDCLEQLKARELTKKIPVIMFSTSSHEKDIEKASRGGAACLLTKPEDYTSLKKNLSDVTRILAGKSSLRFLSLNVSRP